jgi:hypothetical protein
LLSHSAEEIFSPQFSIDANSKTINVAWQNKTNDKNSIQVQKLQLIDEPINDIFVEKL